ncbi:MAG: tetratricopeptide repeat protein [Phycisphaerae bacterium]|nr:tetratricopeptide repeat protein [Phycisphaerae bacterium]MDD5381660.1 tetratricopeptide repeat protein [Phycisphaerae bacterium]
MDNPHKKYWSIYICLVLTLITTVVFCQVRSYDFINYDDPVYIYDNLHIQNGITPETIRWAFTTGYYANWYPLTWLSHMLDWQLFGAKAGGHHLTNLIFHIVNTLLLFIVLKQMTQKLWPSAFVAALFALHPLHVESVAWVAERKDVLSAFFWMLTMWAYLRYVKHPVTGRYLLTLLAFAMGLMAKPMLVTIPFVLLLLDYWPLARVSLSSERQAIYRLIREKVPFFVLSVISSVVTFFVQRSSGTVAELVRISLKIRIFNALVSYVEYIEKMIWPAHLAVFYPHAGRNMPILNVIISAALLAAATILILRSSRNHRYLFTGWFWYLGTLVPVIGLVQVGQQALADRYTYIPLIGVFIIIAWGVPELLAGRRYEKITLTISGLLVILTMSICTHFQLRYWRNSLTLFQHALDVTGGNYTAYIHTADFLCERNKLDEAIAEYRKCLQMIPDDTIALNNLGIALGKQGKFEEAIKCFTEALRIKPDAAAHTNAGHVLALQGNLDEALVHLAEALRLNPNYAQAHYYLGQVLAQRGKYSEAITHFEDTLRLKPDWIEPMNNLAWLLAASRETTIHNPAKAVGLAQRACDLTNYRSPDLLDTLAVAYAAAGDFGKAVDIAEKALELCQSSGQDALKKEIENRLVLYRAGKAYIETK